MAEVPTTTMNAGMRIAHSLAGNHRCIGLSLSKNGCGQNIKLSYG